MYNSGFLKPSGTRFLYASHALLLLKDVFWFQTQRNRQKLHIQINQTIKSHIKNNNPGNLPFTKPKKAIQYSKCSTLFAGASCLSDTSRWCCLDIPCPYPLIWDYLCRQASASIKCSYFGGWLPQRPTFPMEKHSFSLKTLSDRSLFSQLMDIFLQKLSAFHGKIPIGH